MFYILIAYLKKNKLELKFNISKLGNNIVIFFFSFSKSFIVLFYFIFYMCAINVFISKNKIHIII